MRSSLVCLVAVIFLAWTPVHGRPSNRSDVCRPVIKDADKLIQGPIQDQKKAYELLKSVGAECSKSVDYFWRMARASSIYSTIAGAEGNSRLKRELVDSAITYGKKAVEVAPETPEAQTWFAVAVGSRSEFQSTKDKISDGFTFKKHLDKALELNPNDPFTRYLRGTFNYQVSQLSWMEKRLAATFFSEPPSGDIKQGLKDLLVADKVNSITAKENSLTLAKTYIALGDLSKASQAIKKGLSLPTITIDNKLAEKELKSLNKSYGKSV